MRRILSTLLVSLVVCGGSGCQIDRAANPYYALIDGVSDSSPRLDALYHPELDLTRLDNEDGPHHIRRGYEVPSAR